MPQGDHDLAPYLRRIWCEPPQGAPVYRDFGPRGTRVFRCRGAITQGPSDAGPVHAAEVWARSTEVSDVAAGWYLIQPEGLSVWHVAKVDGFGALTRLRLSAVTSNAFGRCQAPKLDCGAQFIVVGAGEDCME